MFGGEGSIIMHFLSEEGELDEDCSSDELIPRFMSDAPFIVTKGIIYAVEYESK